MGFVGYFDVNLYRDIVLTTHPKRHTIGLNSWFPALFPLQNLIRIGAQQTTVILDISRKADVTGVWYEWFVEVQASFLKLLIYLKVVEMGSSSLVILSYMFPNSYLM